MLSWAPKAVWDVLGDEVQTVAVLQKEGKLTRKAGLAPSSSKHFTADVHRLEAAMCKAVPKSKSLQVASTSGEKETERNKMTVWLSEF